MDCEEALFRLKAGNRRFVRGESLHPHEEREWRRHLTHEQHPFAVILGCSGSQAPPELVFDQGFGDLFVVRVAGNVVSPEIMASLQFAEARLGTRLFVVLGHEGCRIVRAALEENLAAPRPPSGIEGLVRLMMPALRGFGAGGNLEAQLPAAVEANVRWSVQQLLERPEARQPLQEKRIQVVGAVCQLETGGVRFLD